MSLYSVIPLSGVALHARVLADLTANYKTLPELIWRVDRFGLVGTAYGDSDKDVVDKVTVWAEAFATVPMSVAPRPRVRDGRVVGTDLGQVTALLPFGDGLGVIIAGDLHETRTAAAVR